MGETVRAQVAQAGAATRAGCAHSSGSVWAMNVPGYRSSGAALCCGLIHQHGWGHPLPIVVTYALVVAEPCAWAGARRVARCNSFEIQTAWSVCTAVRTVLCKDAHHMHAAADSGCNENAHLMCERSNYGRVLVAAEVMELWRRSGDGLALGTHAPLAIERRPYIPVCPSVGGNLGELSAGDLPQEYLWTIFGKGGLADRLLLRITGLPTPWRFIAKGEKAVRTLFSSANPAIVLPVYTRWARCRRGR